MTTLVLGGARSGKSRYAQTLAESERPQRVFVATAEALDEEMRDRISRHIADRGPSWETIEEPLAIGDCVRRTADDDRVILIDCLTLWLSNLMHANIDVASSIDGFCAELEAVTTPLVLVSNEVGMGIVPDTPLGRRFRDAQGRLNQAVAAASDKVVFVAAGLPLTLKG